MLTQEQILKAVKEGRDSSCIDNRDYGRLSSFFAVEHWETFGFTLKEGEEAPTPRPWTREEVLKQFSEDVAFAFEKALNKRGLSASMMFGVIKMWCWVLESPLADFDDDNYAQYGLPLIKAAALEFGFPNEIGDDAGNEHKYSVHG